MRDIKFRTFDKYGIMRFWEFEKKGKDWTFSLAMYEGDKLMQYTGLKDKHGKEIYEGDVIKHDYYYDYGQSGEYKSFTKCVTWDDIYCGFKPMYATGEYSLPRNSIEVVGNIYENPELLDK